MFEQIKLWFHRRGQWHRDHLAAWKGWADDDADGMSRVQRECETAVQLALQQVGVSLDGREAVKTKEGWTYLHFLLSPIDIEFWLYSDTAHFTGKRRFESWRLEEWDARTPSEFIEKTVALALQVVRDCRRRTR